MALSDHPAQVYHRHSGKFTLHQNDSEMRLVQVAKQSTDVLNVSISGVTKNDHVFINRTTFETAHNQIYKALKGHRLIPKSKTHHCILILTRGCYKGAERGTCR